MEQRDTVNNSREEWRHFYEPYQTDKAALKASRSWELIYDWLEGVDQALA